MKNHAGRALLTIGMLAKLAAVIAAVTIGIFLTAPAQTPGSAEPAAAEPRGATSTVPDLAELRLDQPVEAPGPKNPDDDVRAQVEQLQLRLAQEASGLAPEGSASGVSSQPVAPSQQRQQALERREQNPTLRQVDAVRRELAADLAAQLEGDQPARTEAASIDPQDQVDPSALTAAAPDPAADPAAQIDPRVTNLVEEKRASLVSEEVKLQMQREEMERIRGDVDERIEELRQLQANLDQMMDALDEAKKQKQEQGEAAEERENKIGQLVKLMGNMRPPAAAAVLEKLDDRMVADIMGRLQARIAGKVMAALRPDQAARVSEIMSNQDKVKAAALASQAALARADELANETARLAETQPGAAALMPAVGQETQPGNTPAEPEAAAQPPAVATEPEA